MILLDASTDMQCDAQLLQGGRGIITVSGSHVSANPVALPLIFASHDQAEQFLSSCERAGVALYPEMGYTALRQLYDLWHDAWKRPD